MDKNELLELAEELGIYNKIDIFEEDETYFELWEQRLKRYKVLIDKKKKLPPLSLDHIDPRNFNSNILKLQTIKNNIESIKPEDIDIDMDIGSVDENVDVIENDITVRKPIEKTAHILDVDFEYLNGLKIILYTRDVDDTRKTNTVICDYEDYFYIKITEKFNQGMIRKEIAAYEWYLKNCRYPRSTKPENKFADTRKHECNIDIIKKLVRNMELVEDHKSMYGYQPHSQQFLKVTTAYPTVTKHLFNRLSKKYPDMEFFEAHVGVVNKFLTAHKIAGGSAIDIRGIQIPNKLSSCDICIDATSISLNKDAKFYVPTSLFWDIEVVSDDINTFPTSDKCPVIQISYIYSHGNEEKERDVLCFKETPGYDSYETEEQLLIKFCQIIRKYDPDILAGYNVLGFDVCYIIDRLKILGLFEFASQFSKRNGYYVDYKRTTKHSNQFGTKDVVNCNIPGRVILDQFELIKGNAMIRLRSYSLKSVCEEFLKGGQNKEDLAYRDIPQLFETPEGRKKIADYCMKDTVLLLELEKVFNFGLDVSGQAKVLGTTINTIINRGLGIKVYGKLKQLTEQFKLLIPSFTKEQHPSSPPYQGATVLNCDAGFYEDPVCVLDFASLYPSLMRSYNLDFSTICRDPKWLKMYPERFVELNGYHYIKKEYYEGMLPVLQRELAIERKNAKKRMNACEPGTAEHAVWNSIQGGVKILMNSAYGILGSPNATVPAVEIASTITYLGRYNLKRASDFIEKHYCEITGETENCKVIYSDTDSCFILMPGVTVKQAIEYGQKIDEKTKTDLFGDLECLTLEYEKVFCPYLQVTPKRYAGYKYEFDSNKAKVSASGLQLVKRDSALMCKKTMTSFFDYLLVEKDKEKALQSLKKHISDLFGNRMTLEDFELTKKLSKKPEDYKCTVPAHVKAWLRKVERVGTTEAECIGERFAYVIQEFDKKHQELSDAIVDSSYVKEKGFENFDMAKKHYFQLYIYNPMNVIVNLIYGPEVLKSVMDPNNYEQVRKVTASKNNILGFFGKKSLTSRKRQVGLGIDETITTTKKQMKQQKLDFLI